MPQIYKILTLAILVGTLLGFLIAVSIKYPLSKENYDIAQKTCEKHDGWKTMKVAITGKVHTIVCTDSTEFKIN
jgi:hypothetical protein